MARYGLTKFEARRKLLAEAAKYPISACLPDGRVQMNCDIESLYDMFCRRDATGKLSARDREAIDGAIAELIDEGILRGELNGHPLLVDRGYPAREATGQGD